LKTFRAEAFTATDDHAYDILRRLRKSSISTLRSSGMSRATPTDYDAILVREDATRIKRGAAILLIVLLIIAAMSLTGLLDPRRFVDAWPASSSSPVKCFHRISNG